MDKNKAYAQYLSGIITESQYHEATGDQVSIFDRIFFQNPPPRELLDRVANLINTHGIDDLYMVVNAAKQKMAKDKTASQRT